MSPAVQGGTKTATALGGIGFMVNGVPFFNASDGMSYQNKNIWHQNANVVEAPSFDAGKGHPQQTGVYHYHQQPALLRQQLGDDGAHHSPLLGFAFDGFPVYGPYGYTNTDGTGGAVERLDSSYRLRNITTRTTLANGTVLTATNYGPAVSASFPLGYYLEDYEFLSGSGDLDAYNGRFAVTPEFPQGTYAYFTTLDSLGNAAYPYIVGPSYYGTLQNDNRTQTVSVPGTGVSTFNAALSATWGNAAGGEWCDSANWAGGAQATGVGTAATFATVAATPSINVNVTGPERVGSLQLISGSTAYTIAGSSPIVMLAVGGSSVNVTAGSHTISAPLVLGTSTTFNVSSGASVHVTALQQTGVGVTMSGGGTMQLAGLSAGALSVTGGTLALDAGVATARKVSAITVSAGATLDLADGKLIITGGTVNGVSDLVKAGRNGGSWNGTGGIITSMSDAASATALTSLGVATAAQTGRATGSTFAGVTVSASDVLVMYTYAGDANLDGKITVDDYGRIDFNVGLGTSGWSNGDFNYDGKITVDDYGIIDFNVGIQGAAFSTTASGFANPIALSAVPEPASAALLIAGSVAILARARRRSYRRPAEQYSRHACRQKACSSAV
jgi:hypothetical protein